MRSQEDIEFARKNAPGYIGGQYFADLATDEEISEIITIKDKLAEMHNTAKGLEKQFANITKAIKERNKP